MAVTRNNGAEKILRHCCFGKPPWLGLAEAGDGKT